MIQWATKRMIQPTPATTKIPFTREAYEQLQADFARLTQERKEVMVRLQAAREMGDLSENGAYKYAKFELGSIGRQLARLKYLLENGEIVEKTTPTGSIAFGSVVTLQHNHKEVLYTLVSKHESNPAERKISTDSPIGQALMSKKVGDQVKVKAPAGEITYTIIKVA